MGSKQFAIPTSQVPGSSSGAVSSSPQIVQTGLLAQYNLTDSGADGYTLTDSSGNGNHGTLGDRAVVTGVSQSAGTLTITAANDFSTGQIVKPSSFTLNPSLNGVSLTVLSSGLSTSQFKATYSPAITAGTETGFVTVTATVPTVIANTGGLSFAEASKQFVSLPASLNGALTYMLVTYFDPTANGVLDRCAVMAPSPISSVTGPSIFFSATLGGYLTPVAGSVWGIRGWNQAGLLTNAPPFNVHGYAILSYSEAAGGDVTYIYDQGFASNGNSMGTLSVGNLQLGGGFASSGNFYQGQILFAAFWSQALPAAQVSQNVAAVQQLLAARGVVLNGIPGGGTWQTPDSADTIVFDGDSETTFVKSPNLPTLSVSNVFISGWAGHTAQYLSAQAALVVDTLNPNLGAGGFAGYGANKAGIIVNYGTNVGPSTAIDLGSIAKYCRNRKAQGWKVFVTSIMSNQFGGNEDGNKNALNPLIRKYWSDWADGFLNTAACPVLGSNGAFSNKSYSTLGIHWDTTLGEQIAGRFYSYAARRMYGNTQQGTPNIATTSPYLCQPEDIFWIANSASSISAYLIPAQCFTGQTVTVRNIGAGTLTLNPKPVTATITNLSLAANVATVTAANNCTAGDVGVFSGLTTTPSLNGLSGIVSSTGLSATSLQISVTHVNVGSGAETGSISDANYCQIGAITNVTEDSGSNVTLAISNNFSNGSSVKVSGVTTATWLNGQTVTLTAASSTQISFVDGSSHGTYASAADTGTVIFQYPSETINGSSSVTVVGGATCILLSQFVSDAAAGANWITLQNS